MNIQDVYPKHFYQIYSEKYKISGLVGSCIRVDKELDVVELNTPLSTKPICLSSKYIEPCINRGEPTDNWKEPSIYEKTIVKFGQAHQKDKMIEEMAELTIALFKERSGLEHNIAEEIADTQIVLDQMKLLYPDWISWEQVKLRRLEERLE